MISWDAARVAEAAGARLVAAGSGGPTRAVIDTRAIEPGDLFVGLRGERVDGGRFGADALAAGAWGVLVAPEHTEGLTGGAVLAADDPLLALQTLATAWRRELDAAVIGVTGSVGKTSTKQLIAALIAPHRRVAANPANFNTEIGLPLAVLAAPEGTEVLVLEMGMRGFGQIDELARIAEPDVGVITNVGPVHIELVGSLEGVARAKAELLAHVPVAVIPADVPLLDPYLREDLDVVHFGTDVFLDDFDPPRVKIVARERVIELEVPFRARHQLVNLLAAVAAAQAVGVEPEGRVDVEFGALRGEHVELASGVVVINDCYNANPLSMRAALDDLATQAPTGRHVAVLGDMLELGEGGVEAHREIGAHAASTGVDVLVAVGPLSAEMRSSFRGELHLAADAQEAAAVTAGLVRAGDIVLVKASRGIGLETVAEALARG
ncbi:UDP-N-acetylmuramoyl-tripeptide--D-alanyl-D-alanine ligase [Solirubrobacter sp. CPCC 204708]|uniref:UDP-N-acetylmuramoyl-tripeptide--D-alanyl-D-alanine ligase n=1 Tax=Solirubrobacter deserti TaxID=2282478 RepID=A0ABT4RDV2_9ACTN|nr:UDP-N-acetylmuramoyl-tripeptide--D-alanyl-D-alanine ligase [Solirubrobacter deserti]MBE2314692.1 UDP-N-acetylmuramoyl-tripeptide--D-alanyl-D-alanine ligase [Solirubrobacter deserti]MDA0136700.1 UDP-N-acetylmuramoyl-tripeptide--D-alanyl-D-alanine ligase [Solirubrobacter deserti]